MYRVIRRFLLHNLDRTTHILGVLRSTDAIWPCWIKSLNLPLKGNAQSGWKIHRVFKGSTASMKKFSCHVSVLDSGKIPHTPHDHKEEELLILLSGEADIMTLDDGSHIATTRIVPGSIVYHSACQKHTLQSGGSEPATYLIFKWTNSSGSNIGNRLRSAVFHSAGFSGDCASQTAEQMVRSVIFDSPTGYLRKLRCHITDLEPGAGYAPHSDAYDVAILTLSGTVETLDRRVGPCSIIFYAAGEPHGMNNTDTIPARYIVIEFHGDKFRQKWYSSANKEVHILRRLFRRS